MNDDTLSMQYDLLPDSFRNSSNTRKWDLRFLDLARHISIWSKDPSTKCGAVIVRPNRTIVSVGFNGFPRDMDDSGWMYGNRETKYARIVHAEMNAILSASENLEGCALYAWPFLTCNRCAVHVIQAGIEYVVAPETPPDKQERWRDAFAQTRSFYDEAAVEVNIYKPSEVIEQVARDTGDSSNEDS